MKKEKAMIERGRAPRYLHLSVVLVDELDIFFEFFRSLAHAVNDVGPVNKVQHPRYYAGTNPVNQEERRLWIIRVRGKVSSLLNVFVRTHRLFRAAASFEPLLHQSAHPAQSLDARGKKKNRKKGYIECYSSFNVLPLSRRSPLIRSCNLI